MTALMIVWGDNRLKSKNWWHYVMYNGGRMTWKINEIVKNWHDMAYVFAFRAISWHDMNLVTTKNVRPERVRQTKWCIRRRPDTSFLLLNVAHVLVPLTSMFLCIEASLCDQWKQSYNMAKFTWSIILSKKVPKYNGPNPVCIGNHIVIPCTQ